MCGKSEEGAINKLFECNIYRKMKNKNLCVDCDTQFAFICWF